MTTTIDEIRAHPDLTDFLRERLEKGFDRWEFEEAEGARLVCVYLNEHLPLESGKRWYLKIQAPDLSEELCKKIDYGARKYLWRLGEELPAEPGAEGCRECGGHAPFTVFEKDDLPVYCQWHMPIGATYLGG